MKTTARDDAESLLAGNESARYGISTDSEIRPGVVVVGMAIRGIGSCLLAVQAAKYDGRAVLAALDRCNSCRKPLTLSATVL